MCSPLRIGVKGCQALPPHERRTPIADQSVDKESPRDASMPAGRDFPRGWRCLRNKPSSSNPLLNQGGVMFGATLLSEGVYRSLAAKGLMAFYNSKGDFYERST